MKKISEMSLEEVQDYAVQLEQRVEEGKQREHDLEEQITELGTLNRNLQKRNSDLFMQIEQKPAGDPAPTEKEPVTVESCEDFARKLIKGV